MNAHKFVKQYGLSEAIRYSKMIGLSNVCGCSIDDLKRLVESHDLADRLGGVGTIQIMIEQMEINDLCDGVNISFDGEWQGLFTKCRLQQAISDVEQCQ